MESQPLVLVLDEVPPLLKLIELELGFQGMRMASSLLDGDPVAHALEIQPDVIVIGAVIPTPEIYDVLERLRAAVPSKLLFVNGSGNDGDSALALQMGADDSISRPFLPEALGMHIRSLIGIDTPESTELRRGRLRIDYLRRIVWNGEMKLQLGTNEWGLLLSLARRSEPAGASELLAEVWGEHYAAELSFMVLWIHRLRVNLGDNPDAPKLVLGDLDSGYWLAD